MRWENKRHEHPSYWRIFAAHRSGDSRGFSERWTIHFAKAGNHEKLLAQADVILPEHIPVDEAFLRKAPKLRFIQTGAGFDNIDLEACACRGICVCNARGINADAVSEHVMALLLCHYKNICRLNAAMHENQTMDYQGGELAGKTIGIVSMGHIGRAIAKRCQAFDMKVLGYSYRPMEACGVSMVDLPELYHESDIVSLHLPLCEDTRGLIDRRAFAQMKKDAVFVNTARGGLVNEKDLISALQTGQIAAALLDVYEKEPLAAQSPLRQFDNVILTPHTAGYPDDPKFHAKRYQFFAENIQKWANGQNPDYVLNSSEVGQWREY